MISVIIPIYGRAQYLDLCLSSIVEQSYKNIEIICVMDGPCDVTKQLLNKWEKKDSRIKHFEIEHQGAAVARNEGMNQAVGEFIFFSDADDFIPRDSFLILEEKAKMTGADVVIGDYYEIFDNGKKYYFKTPSGESDDFNSFLESVTVWNRLYRKKWICEHKIQFDSRFRGDDRIFMAELFLTSPKISVVNEVVYHWLRHDTDMETSITHNRSAKAFFNDLDMWNYFMDIMPLLWNGQLNDHMRHSCHYIGECFSRVINGEEKQIAFEKFKKLVSRIKWEGYNHLFFEIFKMEKEEWLLCDDYLKWLNIFNMQ